MSAIDIADFLDEVCVVRRKLTRPDIQADSPAAHYEALARKERGTTVLTDRVVIVADLLTLVAGEHLASIAALLRADEYVFGLFPLARSVIEHSSAVVWVLDPHCSPEELCARAALVIDRSNEGLVKASAHLATKKSETYKAQQYIMQQHRAEVMAQFPQDTDLKDNRMTIAGQILLSPTDLVKHFAMRAGFNTREWEGIYDYLCAVANHPTLAAFEFFGDGNEDAHLPIMSEDFLERLGRAVLAAYLMALQAYVIYLGLDKSVVQGLKDRGQDLFPDPLD